MTRAHNREPRVGSTCAAARHAVPRVLPAKADAAGRLPKTEAGGHFLHQLIRERPGEVMLCRRVVVPNIATYAEFAGKCHYAAAVVLSEYRILVVVRAAVAVQDVGPGLDAADASGRVRHDLTVGAKRVGPEGVGHIAG